MITRDTAEAIWECYREIAAAEKLLADMAEAEKEFDTDRERARYEPRLRDAFGRRADLQLGVPSGDACHRLFRVAPELAKACITAHIAQKRAELVEANERARLELDGVREEEPITKTQGQE